MNIVVNGGTKGIGREIVEILSKNSENTVIVTGRNSEALSQLEKLSANIKGICLDLASPDTDYDIFIKTLNNYIKSVDILINNAGLLIAKKFSETTISEVRTVFETNLIGPSIVIRKVKPLMPQGSHIVNISSMGGFQGSAKFNGLSFYSASKAAIASLSECLANEFTSERISVNCLALGSVQTEMLNQAFPGYKAPLSASKIAEFIAWFALNGHKYFNGKILPVALSVP